MISTKSPEELELMHRANSIVLKVLEELRERAKPGVSTGDLDDHAHGRIRQEGVRSAFLGYRGFPKVLCASVNEEIVHGIPSSRKILNEGDIVGLDFGVVVEGFFGDSAITVPVGAIPAATQKLLDVTEDSLRCAIEAMRPGNHISDVSRAVQTRVERDGYSIVRDFVGHGIGTAMHEDPPVPNYVMGGRDVRLVEGMVLAIEPMVNIGRPDVVIESDSWTARTGDRSLSAHFERSVAVTANGPRVLGEEAA